MAHCLSCGSGNSGMLWKSFTLDKATTHLYVKWLNWWAAPAGGEDTAVYVGSQDRSIQYGGQIFTWQRTEAQPKTLNQDIVLNQSLPAGTVITVGFTSTGAAPDPWGPCLASVVVSTDPIP